MPTETKTKPVAIVGWRKKRTYRVVVCDWPTLAAEEGDEPLTAQVRDDLTFDEIARIPFGEGVKYADLWAAIAPYVLSWNVVGQDADGNAVVLPAPMDAGPDIFAACHKYVADWLGVELKFGHLRDVEKKEPISSVTPSGPSDDA